MISCHNQQLQSFAQETMGTVPHNDIQPNASPDVALSGSQSSYHIWVITGPAGCGKSTVASHIAEQLSLPFVEGDEFHPPANISKMSSGTPLTDADRWDWLIILRQRALDKLSAGSRGVVLTCSALKRKYRDVMRIASYNDNNVVVHFMYLRASESLLHDRVRNRQGHYMKDEMVTSQFQSLEEPSPDESDCTVVDVSGTVTEVQDLAVTVVRRVMDGSADITNEAS